MDIFSIKAVEFEELPSLSPAYDELVEVRTCAVAKLIIDCQASKTNPSCPTKHSLNIGAFCSFRTSTLRCQGPGIRHFLLGFLVPMVSNYFMIMGLNENGYGRCRVEETIGVGCHGADKPKLCLYTSSPDCSALRSSRDCSPRQGLSTASSPFWLARVWF